MFSAPASLLRQSFNTVFDPIYDDFTYEGVSNLVGNVSALLQEATDNVREKFRTTVSSYYYLYRPIASGVAGKVTGLMPTPVSKAIDVLFLPVQNTAIDAVANTEDAGRSLWISFTNHTKCLIAATAIITTQNFIWNATASASNQLQMLSILGMAAGYLKMMRDYINVIPEDVMLSSIIYKSVGKKYSDVEEKACEHGVIDQIKALLAEPLYFAADMLLLAATGYVGGEFAALILGALIYGRSMSLFTKGELCTEDRNKKLANENIYNFVLGISLLLSIGSVNQLVKGLTGIESFFIRTHIAAFMQHLYIPGAVHKKFPNYENGHDLFKHVYAIYNVFFKIVTAVLSLIVKGDPSWRSTAMKMFDEELIKPFLKSVDPHVAKFRAKLFENNQPNPVVAETVRLIKKSINAFFDLIKWGIWFSTKILQSGYSALPDSVHQKINYAVQSLQDNLLALAKFSGTQLVNVTTRYMINDDYQSYEKFVSNPISRIYLNWNAPSFNKVSSFLEWMRTWHMTLKTLEWATSSKAIAVIQSDAVGELISIVKKLLIAHELDLKVVDGQQVIIFNSSRWRAAVENSKKDYDPKTAIKEEVEPEFNSIAKAINRFIHNIRMHKGFNRSYKQALDALNAMEQQTKIKFEQIKTGIEDSVVYSNISEELIHEKHFTPPEINADEVVKTFEELKEEEESKVIIFESNEKTKEQSSGPFNLFKELNEEYAGSQQQNVPDSTLNQRRVSTRTS